MLESLEQWDKVRLRELVHKYAEESARGGDCLRPVFADLASMLRGLLSNDDLLVSTDFLAFTAYDGLRYYASLAGLWVFGESGRHVTPDQWFLAVVETNVQLRLLDSLEKVRV